jgi:4-hydroxy-3-polyprenylbenzoate decarboxylase
MIKKPKIVVAITGASGSIYAERLLYYLQLAHSQFERVDLVFSTNALQVWEHELGSKSYQNYDFQVYESTNFLAPFASGSAGYDVMIVCPASMGTLGRIAHGISNDLISRAADVMLKEKGKLIVVPRETPYNLIHLRNLTTLAEAGAIVVPATPSFYSKPSSIEALVDTVVHRVLALAEIDIPHYQWGKED